MILVSTQTFPPAVGGIENLMEGFARHACSRGHSMVVLADGGSAARQYDAETPAPYRTERFGGPRPLRRWRKARRTAQLLAGGDVDAVYVDSWKSLEALPSKPILAPVVSYAHGNEIPFEGKKRKRIGRALRRAKKVIAVSRHTLETRLRGCLPDGVEAVVLHPPAQQPEPASLEDRTFAENAWPADGFRIVCLCRLIELKGVDQTIRAMAAIPGTTLVIAGDGPDRGRLEELAAELGVGHRVRFVGKVAGGRKTALLDSAHVFLQPGRAVGTTMEAYGISTIEAALAGLPAIAGKAGGAHEAVIDGATGLVVDGEDGQAVVAAVDKLASDKELRARFAEAGRTHGEANLWPRQIDKILAVAGL